MRYVYKDIGSEELNKEEEKIIKLLSLAFENKNEHEQKVAMKKAEKLAKKHNIDIDKFEKVDNKNVYYYECFLNLKKLSVKYHTIFSFLSKLKTIFPVKIYFCSENRSYMIYSNFKESIIVIKELLLYLKHIYKYKTADYICSFIEGFVEAHKNIVSSMGNLIIVNDVGIEPTLVETKTKEIEMDPRGYYDGKRFVDGINGEVEENQEKKILCKENEN